MRHDSDAYDETRAGSSETDIGLDTAGEPVLARAGSRVLLVGAGNDSAVETSLHDLAAALIAQARVPTENVRMLLNPPSNKEFRDAVANIAAEAGDTLLVYYIGPGQLGPDGELQLATNAAEGLGSQPVDGTISCSWLLSTARDQNIRTVVVILDCSLTHDAYMSAATLRFGLLPEAASNEFLLVSIAADDMEPIAPGAPHMALTEALNTLLRRGASEEPPDLTLHDLHHYVSRSLPSTNNLHRGGDLTAGPVLARNPIYPAPRPRRRHRRRPTLIALGCVLMLLIVGGLWLWSRSSGGQGSLQARSEALIIDSKNLRPTDPGLAAQLAIAAYRDAPTEQAAEQLYASLNTPLDGLVDNTGNSVLRVAAAANAPLVAASDQDQTLRIWNTANPAAPVLDATVKAGGGGVALTPHGNLLAGKCETPPGYCLWDLTDPHRPTNLARLPTDPSIADRSAQVTSMAFSPDGSLLAAATEQGFTTLWSIADPKQPRFVASLPNPSSDSSTIAAVAFAPHSNLLAESVLRGTTRLWDITNPSAPTQVATMDTGYASVAFSPDGNLLAAVGDLDVGLWNIQQPSKPVPINVSPGTSSPNVIDLSTVTFSADGTRLAFAGSDTAEVTGELCTLDLDPYNLSDFASSTCTATGFSLLTMTATSNGALFTGGGDGAVRLWRSALPRIDGVNAIDDQSWSPSQNGRLLAAPIAAPDFQPASSVGVWDIGGSGGPSLDATLPTSAKNVTFLNPTTLLIARDTGPVQLWDLADPRHPVQGATLGTAALPNSANGWPLAAAIAEDRAGDLVSLLDGAGLLHLWHVTGAANAVEVGSIHPATAVVGPSGVLSDGHTAWLITSAGVEWWDIGDLAHPVHRGTSPFSNTGGATAASLLALSTEPNARGGQATLDLFTLAGGGPPSSTTVSSSVTGLPTLSQDGRLLAAVGIGDSSVPLWDVHDPRQPQMLTTLPTQADVEEVVFDQTGNLLADWNNHAVELWNIHDTIAPNHEATMSLQSQGTGTPDTIFSTGFIQPGGPLGVATDRSIVLFDTDPARLADRLCSYTGTAITPAQWQKYAPALPYQKPCP